MRALALALLCASLARCEAQRFTLVIERAPAGKVFVNGTAPGPTLRALPGTRVSVLVVNALPPGSVTTVHWHGISQTGTPQFDGVLGVTQAPIAAGESFLYEFMPQSSGVYWYHGHHGGQRVDGLFGALLVQPKNKQHEDVWIASELFPRPFSIEKGLGSGSAPELRVFGAGGGSEPVPQALLINGARAPLNARGPVVLINAAEMAVVEVSGSLVVHELDAVATRLFSTGRLMLPPGSRAVVGGAGGVTVRIAAGMYPSGAHAPNFTWSGRLGAPSKAPRLSPAWAADENCMAARPLQPAAAPAAARTTLRWAIDPGGGSVNGAAYVQNASAAPVLAGLSSMPYNANGSGAVPFVVRRGEAVDVLVQNRDGGDHAFHLHGYRLWLVASSDAPGAEKRLAPHYALRDVAIVRAGGWLRARFVASNAGAWVAHCHMEIHFRSGLASLIVVH